MVRFIFWRMCLSTLFFFLSLLCFVSSLSDYFLSSYLTACVYLPFLSVFSSDFGPKSISNNLSYL